MTRHAGYWLARRRLHSAILAMAVSVQYAMPVPAQHPALSVEAVQASAPAGVFPMTRSCKRLSRLKKFGIYAKQYT